MTPRSHMHAAALRMIAKGWKIFPCAGKVPSVQGGFKSASSSQEDIDYWWNEQPLANIGLATGQASGFWVLDIDVREDKHGIETMVKLEEEHGEVPSTLTVRTGSGGLHLYFKLPADRTVRNRAGILPGIDARGDGGYVVAPPSTHPDTHIPYTVPALGRVPIEEAPVWLLDLVAPPKPPPVIRPPAPQRVLPPGEYAREAARRLREDPGARERAGEAVGGVIAGEGPLRTVKQVMCPQCSRPSVWWAVHPQTSTRAHCNHRNTCGWSGPLEELLR